MEMSIGPLHSGQDRRGRDPTFRRREVVRAQLQANATAAEAMNAVAPWFSPADGGYCYLTQSRVTMGPFRTFEEAAADFSQHIGYLKVQRDLDAEAERRRNDFLTEQEVELVDLIQEECGEVVKARSKLRRNGDRKSFIAMRFRDRLDPEAKTNLQDLEDELFDMLTLICLADERGLIDLNRFPEFQQEKLAKLATYTDLFREPGEPSWLERLGV